MGLVRRGGIMSGRGWIGNKIGGIFVCIFEGLGWIVVWACIINKFLLYDMLLFLLCTSYEGLSCV